MTAGNDKDMSNAQKDGCWPYLVSSIMVFGFLFWAAWQIAHPEKPLEQRRRELQDFTDKRQHEEIIRESNKIIYEEMLRNGVRNGN